MENKAVNGIQQVEIITEQRVEELRLRLRRACKRRVCVFDSQTVAFFAVLEQL